MTAPTRSDPNDLHPRLRDVLWADLAPLHAAIVAHPFLRGLADGTLPRSAFLHYVVQDGHYLRGYARALAGCAARATHPDATVMFARHAADAVAAERELHASLVQDLGATADDAAATVITPTTRAYVSYLMATVLGGSYPEAVGAVLPCYWIYAEVGEALRAAGSPDPLYARWIAAYADPGFQEVVRSVLDEVDRVGRELSDTERDRVRDHVRTTARYEWMFWDAAWRQETWPV